MTDQTNETITENNSEQTTEEANAISFDVVSELKNAVQIIDHAAEQGAFKGWNVINQVLGCRSRLVAYIELFQAALNPQDTIETVQAVDGTVVVETPEKTAEEIAADERRAAIAIRKAELEAELSSLADQ